MRKASPALSGMLWGKRKDLNDLLQQQGFAPII
jgi:hypothetical protein